MRHYFGIAVGLGLLVVTLSFTNAGHALAQGALKPVMAFIVNDSHNPVPVTGDIGLAAGSSITIDNPATSPVPTQDVDGVGAREIVSRVVEVNMAGGSGSCDGLVEVPAGKRLVVEHISASLFIVSPTRPLFIGLAQVGSGNFMVTTPAISQGVVNTFNMAVASQQMHIYSDVSVEACVGLSAPSNQRLNVAINGYLTDRY